MKKQLLILLSSSILLLSFIVIGCSNEETSTESTATNASTKAEELVRTVNVEVHTVTPETFTSYIKLIGTVEADNDILVASEVGGRISKLMVKKGDVVSRGMPLAKTDDSQLKREKERLQAVLSQAKTTYERLKKLYEEEKIGSEIDYLNAKYAYEQAEASLSGINEQLAKTLVKSPFNGTVEDILIEEGENAMPGNPIMRLVASDGVKITAGVPSRYADVVKTGDQAEIWFDVEQPDTLSSTISFVGNSIDPYARTFEIEIMMPASSPVTKIDMMANLRLKAIEKENQILVSNEFILDKNGRKVVYVAQNNANGKSIAIEREVVTGYNYNSVSIIEKGLMPNEELITLGAAFVKDKSRITIVNRDGETLVSFMDDKVKGAPNAEQ